MQPTILVVDDDKKITNLIAIYLKNEGYQVITAYDGEEALDRALTNQPDLVILDLMLPKLNGIEVCEILREKSDIPIIMLTARTTEEDKLLGLNIGADDYVTKPFSPRELVARVSAVLRRSESGTRNRSGAVTFAEITVDFIRREVRRGDQVIDVTPAEFRLLEALVKEPGRSFSRKELIERVFGYDYDGLDRTIDVHIMNLRKKIKSVSDDTQHIVTVAGFGYRFDG
jgi:DNA-binding response OmpR family regulator